MRLHKGLVILFWHITALSFDDVTVMEKILDIATAQRDAQENLTRALREDAIPAILTAQDQLHALDTLLNIELNKDNGKIWKEASTPEDIQKLYKDLDDLKSTTSFATDEKIFKIVEGLKESKTLLEEALNRREVINILKLKNLIREFNLLLGAETTYAVTYAQRHNTNDFTNTPFNNQTPASINNLSAETNAEERKKKIIQLYKDAEALFTSSSANKDKKNILIAYDALGQLHKLLKEEIIKFKQEKAPLSLGPSAEKISNTIKELSTK